MVYDAIKGKYHVNKYGWFQGFHGSNVGTMSLTHNVPQGHKHPTHHDRDQDEK